VADESIRDDLYLLALHEAGHSVIACRLGIGLSGLSIEGGLTGDGLPGKAYSDLQWLTLEQVAGRGRQFVGRFLVVLLAGTFAEGLVIKTPTFEVGHDEADVDQAINLAASALHGLAYLKRFDTLEVRFANSKAVQDLYVEAGRNAKQVVEDDREAILTVADELLHRGRLSKSDVLAIMSGTRLS
jgi:hypothetical protein